MKPSKNPFAPGVGMPPPELAGRDELLSEARLTIQRNKNGMIYSPRYGQTAFTVPLFDEYMKRVQPEFS